MGCVLLSSTINKSVLVCLSVLYFLFLELSFYTTRWKTAGWIIETWKTKSNYLSSCPWPRHIINFLQLWKQLVYGSCEFGKIWFIQEQCSLKFKPLDRLKNQMPPNIQSICRSSVKIDAVSPIDFNQCVKMWNWATTRGFQGLLDKMGQVINHTGQ